MCIKLSEEANYNGHAKIANNLDIVVSSPNWNQ
jgi:hypothetical protein